MTPYVKLLSALSTGALLGCTQLSLAPALGEPVATWGLRAPESPGRQPGESRANPEPELERLFIMGRAAHDAGQLALAEERYAQVLRHQPSHLQALNGIAVIYAQTQRIDQALQFFKRALELDPQASHLHNNLGYALMREGRLVEAERELGLAHDLNPSSPQTRQNMVLLSQAKARVMAQAGLSGNGGIPLTEGLRPQLVAIGHHVYELRDGAAAVPEPLQAFRPVGVQPARPATRLGADFVTQDSAISTSLRGIRIEVSNGVGIRHLARRTAERLEPMGLVTARLSNQRYRQSQTEIQYRAGQKNAAQALSAKLPVAVKTVPSNRLGKRIEMRLVLGHDLFGQAMAARLESSRATGAALAGDYGWRWS